MDNKKVAIIHAPNSWYGGASTVAVNTIMALAQNCELSVYTSSIPNIASLNSYYACDLDGDKINFEKIDRSYLWNFDGIWSIKRFATCKFAESIEKKYDLLFSTYYEIVSKNVSIQYVHSPGFATVINKNLTYMNRKGQKGHIKKYLRRFAAYIYGRKIHSIRKNITLANSLWTQKGLEEANYENIKVLNPPVNDDIQHVDWKKKSEGFVCVGRVVPSKRIKNLIKIIEKVRLNTRKNDIHLHIVGNAGAPKYFREVKKMSEKRSWVFVEGEVSRRNLVKIISRHKYGIHGKKLEHFGISVAEMLSSGSIVFVPDGGGQTEIVDDPRLQFKSPKNAVQIISAVLEDEKLRFDIRRKMYKKRKKFSAKKFRKKTRKIVNEVL